MSDANTQLSRAPTSSGGEEVVKASSLVNSLQVTSWRIIEALIECQYDLASVKEIASYVGCTEAQARRCLLTWEVVGLAERRNDLWRLTSYLTSEIPQRLKLVLAEKFKQLEDTP